MATKIVPAGQFDIEGLKKVGKGALIAAIGAGVIFGLEQIPTIDFGSWTPVAVAVSSILVNFLRLKLLPYTVNK